MKSINIKNLTFKYDEGIIIDELSLDISKQSFISIIGPNGSGKSTLLKLIASNLTPNEGVIYVNDKAVKEYRAKDLAMEMAVVPQETGISYDFTVEDIVTMGRYPHIKRFKQMNYKDIEIIKEAMEATNTWHLRDRNINEISGGERQRVIIAKAIAQEPRIILLDEPTSSLDIHHQIELLELLKDLNNRLGVTIVAVLHDMNLAARFSTEIILLHNGRLVTMGTTGEVMTVENLQKAYDMDMIIEKNIYTGSLQIHPLSIKKRNKKVKPLRIHAVCGGGSGQELIQGLIDEGYNISIGVVNEGDSDWQLGRIHGLEMAIEQPFNEISDKRLMEGKALADKADIVVMTDIPIGWGNLKNLQILRDQLEKGKTVYSYSYVKNKRFDYTDGKGEEEIESLKSMGLIDVANIEELLALLNGNTRN